MRTRSLFLTALFALVATAAFGCSKKETIDSADVTTHGMSLDYQVTSNGSTTDVLVALHVGDHDSNTFASLSAGDALTLHIPGQPDRGLQQQTIGGKTIYVANGLTVVSGDFV